MTEAEYEQQLLNKLNTEGTGEEISHKEEVANRQMQLAIREANRKFQESEE